MESQMYLNYSEVQPSFNMVKWYTVVKILAMLTFVATQPNMRA